MRKLTLLSTLAIMLLMSSCAFTNLFTKNLLDQKRKSFVGMSKSIMNEEGMMFGMSTASGAAIGHTKDRTFFLTARHFCEGTGPKFIDVINIHTHKMENAEAEIIAMDKEIDACIVSTRKVQIRPILIANNPPEIGEKVYNLAAPQGVFGEDLVLLYEGFYSGKLTEGPMGNVTADIYSLPANPGSSGSPIIDSHGRLIGVVFAIHSRFHHITLSTPFEKLKSFIESNMPSE